MLFICAFLITYHVKRFLLNIKSKRNVRLLKLNSQYYLIINIIFLIADLNRIIPQWESHNLSSAQCRIINR